jgi:hypothetical protein
MNANNNYKDDLINVSGYIRVEDRDKSGNIIQVALETDEMEKFIIYSNDESNELINFVDKRVLVTGSILNQDYLDYKLITINKFFVQQ